jgi:hypothetical protein
MGRRFGSAATVTQHRIAGEEVQARVRSVGCCKTNEVNWTRTPMLPSFPARHVSIPYD